MNLRNTAASIMGNIALAGGTFNLVLSSRLGGTTATVCLISALTCITVAAGLGIVTKGPR